MVKRTRRLPRPFAATPEEPLDEGPFMWGRVCGELTAYGGSMKPALFLGLACALFAAPAPLAAGTPLSIDQLWQIKRLGAPSLSPDGKWAVVAVTSYDVKADKALTDLWLVPTTPGEAHQLTSHEGSESNPAWSPDGK